MIPSFEQCEREAKAGGFTLMRLSLRLSGVKWYFLVSDETWRTKGLRAAALTAKKFSALMYVAEHLNLRSHRAEARPVTPHQKVRA